MNDKLKKWEVPPFDIDLILKYDKPGPRYTSYPTAPYFTENFKIENYVNEVKKCGKDNHVSLYFHLPFCDSVCWFCGCNVHYTKDKTLTEKYVETMIKELKNLKGILNKEKKLVQVHFGGGTPTFIPAKLLKKLTEAIKEQFEFADAPEIGIELDPRSLTDEHYSLFEKGFFNRFSIGIQDFDEKVQRAVHRVQSEELTFSTFKRLRNLGAKSINVDLIYGLPHQTKESFKYTVDKIIELNPDRIAVFNFAYLPEMLPHQRAIKREFLPSPVEKLRIFEMVIDSFTKNNYVFIGMDHFAKTDDELFIALENRTLYRNFQGYTTKGGADLFGIGATSIGQFGRCYSQNLKEVSDYINSVESNGLSVFRGVVLTDDDLLRRDIILKLMCHFVLYKKEIEEKYNLTFDETFKDSLERLKSMEEDDLLSLKSDRIEIKPLGRLLVRNICMAFDAYLKRDKGEKKFSRTV